MAQPLVVRRKFTVEEYHRLAEVGILGEDDRVELIDGEIVQMSPIGNRHAGTVDFLAEHFLKTVGGRGQVRVQNPVRLGEDSEPQPDLALLRPRGDYYRGGHPGPEDVLLVVEVAETSADYDREVKLLLYARWGVPEAWLVDLEQDRIEVYRSPSPEGYREVQVVARGEQVAPAAFPEAKLRVDDLLG